MNPYEEQMRVKMSDGSISKWYDPLLFGVFFPLLAMLVKMLYRTNRMVVVEGVEKKDAALTRSPRSAGPSGKTCPKWLSA